MRAKHARWSFVYVPQCGTTILPYNPEGGGCDYIAPMLYYANRDSYPRMDFTVGAGLAGGVCCVTSGEEVSCQTVPASVCSFYGGEYGGDGTDCVNDDNCVPPVQCASDINDDGRVDVGDLLQVIGDWGCIE